MQAASVVSRMSGGEQPLSPSQQNMPVRFVSSVQPATGFAGFAGGGGGGVALGGLGSGGETGESSIVAVTLESVGELATIAPSTSSRRPVPRP